LPTQAGNKAGWYGQMAKRWLEDTTQDHLKKDLSEFTKPEGKRWRIRVGDSAFIQGNDRDCGVITLLNADLIAAGVEDFRALGLTVADIDTFRVKIGTDILRGGLPYDF
jgi:hypothetical protein